MKTLTLLAALLVSYGAYANDIDPRGSEKAIETPSTKTRAQVDAIALFTEAGRSGLFFENAYGYAVFPTIGKGGAVIGAAYGKGRVVVGGKHVGDTSLTQVTLGPQFGGQAFSQIIFFEDKHAFDEFTGGNFELGAQASAVAITASASAGATTFGLSAGASGGQDHVVTAGKYYKGMAIFTVAKGGLMFEATVGGQKFNYTPL